MKEVDEKLIKEVAESYLIQKDQRDKVDRALVQIEQGMNRLNTLNNNNNDELDRLLEEALNLSKSMGIDGDVDNCNIQVNVDDMLKLSDEEVKSIEIPHFEMISTIDVNEDWDSYMADVHLYAENNGIDLTKDPFENLLTQTERNEIGQRLRDDYLMKKAECDKYDYIIAAFCGTICGLIDSFFVKCPSDKIGENSKLGQWTDEQADKFVEHISKKIWKIDSTKRSEIIGLFESGTISREQRDLMMKEAGIPYNQNLKESPKDLQQCIQYLEKKFSVNYDASSAYYLETNNELKKMNPGNHHIMSLGHMPSIIGLIFSVVDQFTGKASFIDNGKVIRLVPVEKKNEIDRFELRGSTFATKLICGIVNWIGHLLSDLVGANNTRKQGSLGRGSGLPVPMIELLQMCNFNLPDGNGDAISISELTIKIFERGYDLRFAAATAIPVVLNEFLIRLFWCLKSRFYHNRTWSESIPFGQQPELRRMLLVGHGVLCTIDLTDASIRSVDLITFVMHLNIAAWSRLAISGLQEVRAMYKENVIDIEALDDDLEVEWIKLYESCK